MKSKSKTPETVKIPSYRKFIMSDRMLVIKGAWDAFTNEFEINENNDFVISLFTNKFLRKIEKYRTDVANTVNVQTKEDVEAALVIQREYENARGSDKAALGELEKMAYDENVKYMHRKLIGYYNKFINAEKNADSNIEAYINVLEHQLHAYFYGMEKASRKYPINAKTNARFSSIEVRSGQSDKLTEPIRIQHGGITQFINYVENELLRIK